MVIIRGSKRRRDEAVASVNEAPLMAKVYGKHGVYSRMPQNTKIEAKDYSIDDSCVLRNFPKQKTSDLRFLAWVAYTRKFSDPSMTDIERRTCPLLWCREIFSSEDAMHKHVYTCEHLSKGLYWCPHCQKPERVAKFQCKGCQGTMSTAGRITTVAKKIFSGLGVKRAMGDSPSPAAYRNINSPRNPEGPSYPLKPEKDVQFEEVVADLPECDYMELPNNTISEMEGESIFEVGADWVGPSQELPVSPPVAEMTGSDFATIPPIAYPNEMSSQDPWDLPMCHDSPASTYVTNSCRPSQPISLRLDTGITEPLRQHGLRPDPSKLLSPLSPSDRIGSGVFTVSPTDSAISGKSIFSNSECSSATTASSWDESSNSLGWENDICGTPSFAPSMGRFPSNASDKFFRDGPSLTSILEVPPVTLPDTLVRHPSSSSSSSAAEPAGGYTLSKRPQTLSTHWVDAKSLVDSLSEVLQEHIEHSRQALKKMPPCLSSVELLALSPSSIQSIGFEVLELLLNGRNPSSLVHLFAFTNVAYSMAVAIDRDESKVQTEQWFQNCLSLSTLLSFQDDRRIYEQIARAIWQPQSAITSQSGSFLLGPMERENKLIMTCKHFLDLLQSLGNHEKPSPIPQKQFDFARLSFVPKAKTRVVDKLIQKPSIEAFIEDVVNVENRLDNNFIADVRQLELELICTAKLASQSDIVYSRFINHVTDLCDTMYAECNTKSRTTHHIEAIALTKRLLCLVEYTDSTIETPEFDADLLVNGAAFDPQFTFSGINTPFADFSRDIDAILDESFDFSPFEITSQTSPLVRSFSLRQPTTIPPKATIPPHLIPAISADAQPHPPISIKFRCHYCGYVPTGEERWKASNLSRHKRIQHPEKVGKVGKTYRCQWEGCGSTFTRSDNLREHVRKKGHAVCDGGCDKGASEEGSKPKRRKEMKDVVDTGLR